MIHFDRVTKQYRVRGGARTVLDTVSFRIERGQSIGICGHNGAGKSTLLRLIAGVERPTLGTVDRQGSVSWPIGHASSFQSSLTGADNVRFIARIYRKDPEAVLAFAEEFAELGDYLQMPIRTYSAGMNARLAMAASLAIEIDCYLVDEVTSAGDERFRARCQAALNARRETGTLVMVSHDAQTLRDYCDVGAVLDGGRLTFYDTIGEAIERHFHSREAAA